jgi:hypothetical protein
VEVFTLLVTAPGTDERPSAPHRAVVEWTGPVSPEARRAEIRNARGDGSTLLVDIEVR